MVPEQFVVLPGGGGVNKFRLSEQKNPTQDGPGPNRINKDMIQGGPGPSGVFRSTSVFGVTVAYGWMFFSYSIITQKFLKIFWSWPTSQLHWLLVLCRTLYLENKKAFVNNHLALQSKLSGEHYHQYWEVSILSVSKNEHLWGYKAMANVTYAVA